MTEQTGTSTSEVEATVEPGTIADDNAKVRSREAAKYRMRLREAEADRDKLRAALDTAHRTEVERIVTGEGGLADGADLWRSGLTLDDLRDGEGALDTKKVEAARDHVLAEHPHWRKSPTPDQDGGVRELPPDTSGPSFGEAIKRKVAGGG